MIKGLADLNVVNSGQINGFSLAIVEAVPEPSSAILPAGMATLGVLRRRRS